MSSWDFRWILLSIGVLILVVLYAFGRRRQDTRSRGLLEVDDDAEPTLPGVYINPAEDRAAPSTQGMEGRLPPLDPLIREEAAERAGTASSADSAGAPPRRAPGSATTDDRLIVMHVMAPRPYMIRGAALFEALDGAGLQFDPESRVYVHSLEHFGKRQVVFQLANLVKPGTFDPEHPDGFTTPGVSLFMQLPGPMEGLKAFNTMLECAQRLATQLEARVLDETHSVLTTQATDQLREEIQLFSLRHDGRSLA